MHNMRIHESVAAIAAGYRPESAFIAEAEEKLGKKVDEHKWNKAKSLAEKELGKKTGDQFYAYTMGIYKKMMGESIITEAEGTFRKTQEFVSKDGQHAWRAGKNQTAGTWDHRHYVKKGNGWAHVKDHGYDGHESAEDAAAAAKGDRDMHDKKNVTEAKDEADTGVQIPYKKGHYQVTFTPKKGEKRMRRVYQGEDMEETFSKAKEEIKKDHPESHGYAIHSPQTDESVAAGEVKMIIESEEVEDKSKKADTEHDEAKEEKEDPTREKLETAKDEADEKKGGPAELAADLRVSIRIEKMGLGRYRRMLTKHELSTKDETWLKNRINDLEACVKSMEDKLPELEKEAEGKDIKESIRVGIKKAILELATGK
jgi:hypothetical protein